MDRRIERDRDKERELERERGRFRERERERDYSVRRDKDYSDRREHDKNVERTSSNRSRSPLPTATASTRWDDPLKKFSEKHQPDKPPKHCAPPNRFNIPPGRQWDGIDRSNGFEVAYFKKLAQQERKKDLDYKYTVADM